MSSSAGGPVDWIALAAGFVAAARGPMGGVFPTVMLSMVLLVGFSMAAFFLENGILQNIGELVLLSGCTATGAEAVRRLGVERDERKANALREAAEKRAARSAVADA